MPFVVAERTIPGPFTTVGIRELILRESWCNGLYGVIHCGSLLAPQIDRMVCIYQAPDAESVRGSSQRLEVPYDRVWSATLHGPVGPEPVTRQGGGDAAAIPDNAIVVNRAFETPVKFEDLESREEERAWCLEVYGVRFLQSLLSIDRRRMLCLFAAPDAEAVRVVQHQGGIPFEEIWTAELCRL